MTKDEKKKPAKKKKASTKATKKKLSTPKPLVDKPANDATEFEQAVEAFKQNPSDATSKAMYQAGFAAINEGTHDEPFITATLTEAAKVHGDPSDAIVEPPFDVVNEALKMVREISFIIKDGEKDEEGGHIVITPDTALDMIHDAIDDARELLTKGIHKEAAHFTFTDRKGTADETILLSISKFGFVFPGDVQPSDRANRFLLTINNMLTQVYTDYYGRGYNAAAADSIVPEDIMGSYRSMIAIASRSGKRKDKERVSEAKIIFDLYAGEPDA